MGMNVTFSPMLPFESDIYGMNFNHMSHVFIYFTSVLIKPTLLIVVVIMLISLCYFMGFQTNTDFNEIWFFFSLSVLSDNLNVKSAQLKYPRGLSTRHQVLFKSADWKAWTFKRGNMCKHQLWSGNIRTDKVLIGIGSWLEKLEILTGNLFLITGLIFSFVCGLIRDAWWSLQSICRWGARQSVLMLFC